MRDLTDREKMILGGAGASAMLTFLPWIKFSFGDEGMGDLIRSFGGAPPTPNNFSILEGVLSFLAAVATVALVWADRTGALSWPPRKRLLAPLVSAGGGLLCLLILFGRIGGKIEGPFDMSVGRTIWFWLAVGAMAFATFHAYQRWNAVVVQGQPLGETPQPPASVPQ